MGVARIDTLLFCVIPFPLIAAEDWGVNSLFSKDLHIETKEEQLEQTRKYDEFIKKMKTQSENKADYFF